MTGMRMIRSLEHRLASPAQWECDLTFLTPIRRLGVGPPDSALDLSPSARRHNYEPRRGVDQPMFSLGSWDQMLNFGTLTPGWLGS